MLETVKIIKTTLISFWLERHSAALSYASQYTVYAAYSLKIMF